MHISSGEALMWILWFLVCIVLKHSWTGSTYRYCLRCGKLEAKRLPEKQDSGAVNIHFQDKKRCAGRLKCSQILPTISLQPKRARKRSKFIL